MIHQQPFIVQLLLDFGMEQCKPVCTPAVAERLEADAEGELCDATLYRTIVGKLLWLQSCTRPDLSFAVHQLCRFSCAPRATHLRAAKRVLRFLAGTSWCAIRYRQGANMAIEGWSDSDWAGDVATRKSTSGYAFMVAHGALSWRAGLQSCVALSSAEAEYIGLADAAKEAMHLRQLGRQIGINVSGPTVIRGDNRAIRTRRYAALHTPYFNQPHTLLPAVCSEEHTAAQPPPHRSPHASTQNTRTYPRSTQNMCSVCIPPSASLTRTQYSNTTLLFLLSLPITFLHIITPSLSVTSSFSLITSLSHALIDCVICGGLLG